MVRLYIEWATSTFFGALHDKKYCAIWDAKLNELLDRYAEDARWGDITVHLGEAEIWVANRFYAYGSLYRLGRALERRPSVKTMVRLAALQDGFLAKQAEGERLDYIAAIKRIK